MYIDPFLDTVLLHPPCKGDCWKMPNCFECVHFDYGFHLERFGWEEAKEVRNVAIYTFGLEGLGSLWKSFSAMERLNVVLDDHVRALNSSN